MSVVLFISHFFYLAFSNNVWCVFDICSVSTISLVSLDRCLYSLFFLRRKQQLLSLLKGFEHQRQNKLYAFRAFFPFFSPFYWIFIYVTAVCTQIDLEHLFLFFFFITLSPILPRLELGSLNWETRCRIISVCIFCVSGSRHAFLE